MTIDGASYLQDDVNAFVEAFRSEGAASGPLGGLTFAAKDLFDVKGRVTGCGNPEWARTHAPARETAWAVDALLKAGARLEGKTQTDELAYSLMGVNAHFGTPVNSADPRRVPGGSSSGSAAAVAAGLVDVGLGTDTGGSVRMPAAFCGLWGIRPTFGQISLKGVMPFTHSFDTVGWFSRSGTVLRRTAQVLGCKEGQPLKRLLLPVDIWTRADPECVEAVTPLLKSLQAQLAPVEPVVLALDGLAAWREVFRICQAWEVWDCLGEWVTGNHPQFGPGIKERFDMAAGIDRASFQENELAKQRIRARLSSLVPDGTALVLPTSPAPAPFLDVDDTALDSFRTRALEMLCPAGLAGLPQVSVPAGAVDGGPVGLSLVGAPNQELELIDLAVSATT